VHLSDNECVVKSDTDSVNKKFKDPCNLLTYRDLHFKDVVPLAIEPAEKTMYLSDEKDQEILVI
jgi:hypothetical protein